MKKISIVALAMCFALSCSKDTAPETALDNNIVNLERKCASHDVMLEQEAADPELAKRHQEIEAFIEKYLQESHDRSGSLVTIPVVVNVLYKTASENISDAQIQSQIDILNADFGATNSDYNNTPSIFQNVRSGDIGVAFSLQAINKKSTTKTSWRTDDSMKKATKGGINPTNPTTTLNIWVCNLSNSILGYAQFPGGSAATDGVVIDNNAMGLSGGSNAPFNLGRTATHEVGHWLNLRHIWGDATCGSDLVNDTPSHNTANYNCPTYPHLSTCSGTPVEMTMNYMDYTNDVCMYMFSAGQKSRMHAVFAAGGPRASFNP